MFPTNTSPFAGLTKVILTLVGIGLVVGLVIAGSDLTNFITNSAKAQAIKNQNDLQAQKDAIDLKNYQAIQETTTQIQIEKLNDERTAYEKSLDQNLQVEAQRAAQDLELSRLFNYAVIGVVVFLTFCIGIGAITLALQIGRSRLLLVQAQSKQLDAWQNLAWRKQQIMLSHALERVEREHQLAKSQSTFQNNNGHRPSTLIPNTPLVIKQPGNGKGLYRVE